MVLEEFLGLMNLFGVSTLCIYKTIKVVVIREDKHPIFANIEIVILYFKGFDNS